MKSISRKAQLYKKSLIQIGDNVTIKDHVIIHTELYPVVIGDHSFINPFTVIYGGRGVSIGRNVMVAPGCVFAAGNHNYKQLDKPMLFADSIGEEIVVEDNVWIGANCTITDGVTIGREAIIGANTVVTKDVRPYDVVACASQRVLFNRLERSR